MSLSLVEYAEAKGLPLSFLETIGVREEATRSGARIAIPYFDEAGAEATTRYRSALNGEGFRWTKGATIRLYGVDRLAAARAAGHIVIVEGESDCHTLWLHGFPAVGVPGAPGGWKEERDAYLFDGVEKIHVINEGDKAGKALIAKLKKSTICERLHVVTLKDAKDPSELYCKVCNKNGDAFRERFEAALKEAETVAFSHEDGDGGYYDMAANGLWTRDDSGKLMRLSQSFAVLGLCREAPNARGETEGWGTVVRFRNDDGVERIAVVGRDKLHADLSALCGWLGAMGMDIERDDKRRRALAKYLLRVETDDRVTLVQRAGWHMIGRQRVYVLPHETITAGGSERIILTASTSGQHEARGTLDDWRNGVGRLACGHMLPLLAISTALAGPLLRLVGFEGGGVHIFGKSSTGKTTTVRMAASVWRCGAELPTWRATANGLEGELARASDGLLTLDEMGQSDQREFAASIYMAANGVGKARMRRDTSLRDPLSWLALILSSGETPIETRLAEERGRKARAGHLVRMLDVKVDRENGAFDAMAEGVGVAAFVAECQREAASHYGTAGPAFVRHLLSHEATQEDVWSRVEAFVKAALPDAKSDDGQAGRAAQRFGLVAAAGELAIEYGIVPWPRGAPIEAAKWAFKDWLTARGGSKSYEQRQAIAQVRHFIENFGESRFDPLAMPAEDAAVDDLDAIKRSTVRAGYRKDVGEKRRWLIWPQVWRQEVCVNLDPEFVAAMLAARGVLERSKDRLTKLVKVRGVPTWFYVLTPKILEGDD